MGTTKKFKGNIIQLAEEVIKSINPPNHVMELNFQMNEDIFIRFAHLWDGEGQHINVHVFSAHNRFKTFESAYYPYYPKKVQEDPDIGLRVIAGRFAATGAVLIGKKNFSFLIESLSDYLIRNPPTGVQTA